MSLPMKRSGIYATACVGMLLCTESAWALRCGNDLVLTGEHKIEVLKSCGKPLLVEQWAETGVVFSQSGKVVVGERDTSTVEVWTYNFGPARFIHFLRFVNGRLDEITPGPRGFSGAAVVNGSPECGKIVSKGDRRIELLRECGEPASVDERSREQMIGIRDEAGATLSQGRKVEVRVEEWTYNFGPTRFLVFVTLENGVVVDVQTGDYGF
ncbi:MAG: hypothetical protein FD165_579 [Gammaproteobacteria bacterium]|nr:MAG: hypothetical protein FD165_579 [Gammaproteobacteria bacterium]